MMRAAAIAYRNDELEAWEQDDLWTVRLSNLETRARYLDLALARLLGDAPEAHRAAARLLVDRLARRGGRPRIVTLKNALRVRESCGCALREAAALAR